MQKRTARAKPDVRASVKHVFARQKGPIGLPRHPHHRPGPGAREDQARQPRLQHRQHSLQHAAFRLAPLETSSRFIRRHPKPGRTVRPNRPENGTGPRRRRPIPPLVMEVGFLVGPVSFTRRPKLCYPFLLDGLPKQVAAHPRKGGGHEEHSREWNSCLRHNCSGPIRVSALAIILLKFDPFGLPIRATNTFRESVGRYACRTARSAMA